MRKNRHEVTKNEISILALDDDPIMTATIHSYFSSVGYHVEVENDPLTAIDRIRSEKFDILLLDFLMTPLCGDQVVERIREFNTDLFIILLTGHKSMAPPIRTVRTLDIQGYYEKNDRFDQLELLVEGCVKSIRQMRLIRNYQDSLSALTELMPDIYALQEIDAVCEQILDGVAKLWDCTDSLLVLLPQKAHGEQCLRFFRGTQFAACTAEDIDTLTAQVKYYAADGNLLLETFSRHNGKPVGLLAAATKDKPELYQQKLFETYTRQCAASTRNTVLTRRLKDGYIEIIQALRLMVDAKDIYTRGHSDRVAYYSKALAEALDMDPGTCERIRIAGLFHDIGKVSVPDDILLSENSLTDEQFAEIRKHPKAGYDILTAISSFKDIAPIIRSHHERLDGRGYPDRLSGSQIPVESRIISIADTFDAMTSSRRYRPKLSFEEATDRLYKARGSQLDPELVDVFLSIISRDLPYQLNNVMRSNYPDKKVI